MTYGFSFKKRISQPLMIVIAPSDWESAKRDGTKMLIVSLPSFEKEQFCNKVFNKSLIQFKVF